MKELAPHFYWRVGHNNLKECRHCILRILEKLYLPDVGSCKTEA